MFVGSEITTCPTRATVFKNDRYGNRFPVELTFRILASENFPPTLHLFGEVSVDHPVQASTSAVVHKS
jgi:hypothetical protein